jgi:DNA-binding CsgD family transcriptional regulator
LSIGVMFPLDGPRVGAGAVYLVAIGGMRVDVTSDGENMIELGAVMPAHRDGALDSGWQRVLHRVSLLSGRELQVFRLLAVGRSNREISASLRVTERTTKAHVAQILAKLAVESRLQAGLVAFAWQVLEQNALPAAPCRPSRVSEPPDAHVPSSRDPEQAEYSGGSGGADHGDGERRLVPRQHSAHEDTGGPRHSGQNAVLHES